MDMSLGVGFLSLLNSRQTCVNECLCGKAHPESSLERDGPTFFLAPNFQTRDFILRSSLWTNGQWEENLPRFKPFELLIEKLICCNKKDPEIQRLKESNILFLY